MASDRTARRIRRLEEQLRASTIVNVILLFLLLVAIFMLFSGRRHRDVTAIYVDGQPVVYVRSTAEAQRLLQDVRNEKKSGIKQTGYFDPEQTIEVKSVPAEGVTVSNPNEAKKLLGNKLRFLTQGYTITVDGEPVATMATAEQADDVLNMIKNKYASVGEGQLIRQEFKEDVKIQQTPVAVSKIMTDIAAAAKKLTQTRGKEVTHKVQKGDTPSTIAHKYGISLQRLYALNPGLKERQKTLRIGEKLKVSLPKTGVTVITVKEVQREVELSPGPPEEQKTPNLPQGRRSLTRKAQKGLKLQTVEVKYENDHRLPGEKIIKETVTKQPVKAVVLVGTGPP